MDRLSAEKSATLEKKLNKMENDAGPKVMAKRNKGEVPFVFLGGN
jgi:hypothetical protein